jgi:uncharacterized surface protein with fasciclin (FAS1) repeats
MERDLEVDKKELTMRRVFIILSVLSILLFGIFPSLAQEATEAVEDQAYIRVAHFSPATTGVDVYLDNTTTDLTNLEYRTITDWIAVPVGTHNLSLVPNGSSASESGSAPIEVTLDPGTWTTLAATGSVENGTFAVEAIVENFGEMLPGTANVTFVNAIEGGPNIDIIRNDVTYIPGLFPPDNTETADAGASWFGLLDDMNTFTFRAVDSANPDTVLAELSDVKLNENDVHLIAAIGTADPNDEANIELIVDSTNLAEAEILQGRLEAPGTIIQALRADESLAPIADAIERAGLTETLSGEGTYTLFVPADFVIDEIPQEIMNDPEALQDFLQYHIVEGDLRSQDVFKAGTLTALNGGTLTIEERGENAFVNDAQIIVVIIPATNGTIHVINQAMLPDTVASG